MTRVNRIAVTLLCFFALVGCDGITKVFDDDVIYQIESPIAEDINVLLYRLNQYPVSFLSSIEYDKGQSQLIFKGGVPDERLIHFMSNTLGQLSIYGEDLPNTRVTNKHIVWARPTNENDNLFIRMRLSDEGGKLLHQITKTHIGKKIHVELDGILMFKPTVNDALGKSFMMAFDHNSSNALMTAIALENGSLSKPVKLMKLVAQN